MKKYTILLICIFTISACQEEAEFYPPISYFSVNDESCQIEIYSANFNGSFQIEPDYDPFDNVSFSIVYSNNYDFKYSEKITNYQYSKEFNFSLYYLNPGTTYYYYYKLENNYSAIHSNTNSFTTLF